MPSLAQRIPQPSEKPKTTPGPSHEEVIDKALNQLAAGPAEKVLKYIVVPEIGRQIPILGTATTYLKWAADPVEELRKELDLDTRANPFDPKASEYYAGKMVSHTLGWGVQNIQAVANVIRVGTGGVDTTELVRGAMAYEAAQMGEALRKNPAKFILGQVWNGAVKGDWIFDRFAYDKRYYFYKAADGGGGERFVKWHNNNLVEDFNRRIGRYTNLRVEGDELKFGAHYFTSEKVPKGENIGLTVPGRANPVPVYRVYGRTRAIQAAKGTWQVLAPTVAALAVFPPAAPAVLAFQALTFDWGQFIHKTPSIKVSEKDVQLDIRRYGEFRGLKDSDGNWIRGGQLYHWYKSGPQDLHVMSGSDKVFYVLNNFFTIRGLYETLVNGRIFREVGWKPVPDLGFKNAIADNFGRKRLIFDSRDPGLVRDYFSKRPGRDGLKHIGFNKLNNSFIYEQRRILPGGREVTLQIYKNSFGRWVFANKATASSVGDGLGARVMRGAYQVQQVLRNVGAPVALAVVFPNPLTLAFAGYSTIRYLSSATDPLKRFGWVVKEADLKELQRLALLGKLPKGLIFTQAVRMTNNGKNVLVWFEINGSTGIRRFSRFVYQVFNPFDREVGWLRGIAHWRDSMWARFAGSSAAVAAGSLAGRIPLVRRFLNIVKNVPGFSLLVKGVGVLNGVAKWAMAPTQAINDKIKDFFKWLIKWGVGKAVKKAFTRWLARPLRKWLLQQARNFGSRSFLGRIFRFLSRSVQNAAKPSPSALSKLRNFFGNVGKLVKNIPQYIKKIFDAIKALWRGIQSAVRAVRTMVQVAGKAIQTLAALVSDPAFWIVLLIIIIIVCLVWIAVMLWSLLSFFGGRFGSLPANDYLVVEKTLSSSIPSGGKFGPGDVINYDIKFKVLKQLDNPVTYEDYFLVSSPKSGGGENYFFDPATLDCAEGQGNVEPATHLGGPSGTWYRVTGGYSGTPGDWIDVQCSAKVDSRYVEGELINQIIVWGKIPPPNPGLQTASVSQYLYLNSSKPSGWPVEHACITQGPNTSGAGASHQNQPAVDLASNRSIGYLIDAQPAYSTVSGKVLRICLEGTYTKNYRSGVCGGYDDGSYFGDGFGTYVIVKDPTSGVGLIYAHLSQPSVGISEGGSINKGAVVGYIDNTGNSIGPHLHYALTRNSGLDLVPPIVPYYIPSCVGFDQCQKAFADLGDAGKVCF